MIPPIALAPVASLLRHAVELEERVAQLRALTGMAEPEAYHWLTILGGLQASSPHYTPATAWEFFRWGIMEGFTPAQAAAGLASSIARKARGV